MINEKLTPSEIMDEFPQLKEFSFDSAFIGKLLKAGFLRGTYNRSSRVSEIKKESLFELLNYRNSVQDKNKIEL